MPNTSRKMRRVRNHKKTCQVKGRCSTRKNPKKADALNNPGFTKSLRRRRSGGNSISKDSKDSIFNIISGKETMQDKFNELKNYVRSNSKSPKLRLRFEYDKCDFSAIVELRENSLILSDLRDHLINIQDSSCNYVYSTKNYSFENQKPNDFHFLQENLKYSETGQIRINDPNNNFTYSSRNFLNSLEIVSKDGCHEEQKCQSILENLKKSNPKTAKELFREYNEQLLKETYNSENCETDKEKIIESYKNNQGKIGSSKEINIMKHCRYDEIAKKMIIKDFLDIYKQNPEKEISQNDYDTVVNLGYTDFINQINYAREIKDTTPTILDNIVLKTSTVH